MDDQQCIFNMYGGEISGNNGKNYGGAIFRKFNANMPNTTGGTFNMYGGTIKNNTAKNGGAFFSTTGGTINMTGGTISGNTATQNSNDAGGGAIYMRGNGKINISGSAEITGNSSSLDGGAILMGWGEINISGSAKINSNTASRWGGAICLRKDSNQVDDAQHAGRRDQRQQGQQRGRRGSCSLTRTAPFYLYDGKITGNTSVRRRRHLSESGAVVADYARRRDLRQYGHRQRRRRIYLPHRLGLPTLSAVRSRITKPAAMAAAFISTPATAAS